MKKILVLLILLISSIKNHAQVAIGTITPNSSSLLELESNAKTFVPPRMSTAQMNAIPSPLDGSMIYNTTEDAMYVKTNIGWKSMFYVNNDIILLNKEFTPGNNVLATSNNTYFDIPINASSIIQTDPTTFSVIGDGTIQILKTGVYSIVSGLSTSNLPPGNIKHIIAVYVNGVLYNYLARGIVNNITTDEFGFSGSTGITANTGDIIKIRYVLNNNGTPLDAKFINIGVTRLK
ncbi:hypothetical protein GFJ94_04165 [Flavobacterium sp. LMO8]|uniref:hypothetical protein n=1 Tax=Flavobacterium sp. LMO8 TaxID=2654244 RepID=UPI001291ACD1|nr:hypothetical protein [Flavobacterium sp. LMO8]MQP24257.1 hypothetical protein [Flavobacterium sp. LMO8]